MTKVWVSPLQVDVVHGIARGLTDTGIAEALGRPEDTVASAVRSMRGKLGAVNRIHLVAVAWRIGLLTADGPVRVPELTPRQVRVLATAADGASCKETAREWFVDPSTVRNYRRAANRRLGAKYTAHAVHLAHAAGILPASRTEAT